MGYVTGDGTVGKAIGVLDQVAGFGRPVRFTEVLAESDLPKPTLYRFIQSLTNQGMLVYDPERQTYAPGLRLLRLAPLVPLTACWPWIFNRAPSSRARVGEPMQP